MYYPEGFEYEKKDDEWSPRARRGTYVRYNTSLDESVGYFKVESGVPTPLSWQLHSDFQSEEYRLAIVMLDVTGSALTARREWHSTLTHKDDAVPDGQSRVVNMLLFDIDSTASNTYEMLAGGLNQRMPKFGESSWGMDYTGPCTYPRLPAVRHPQPLSSSSTSTATATRTTSPRSPRPTTSPSPCSRRSSATARRGTTTRAASAAHPQGLARRRDVAGGPFTATASGVRQQADSLYGPTTCTTATTPPSRAAPAGCVNSRRELCCA